MHPDGDKNQLIAPACSARWPYRVRSGDHWTRKRSLNGYRRNPDPDGRVTLVRLSTKMHLARINFPIRNAGIAISEPVLITAVGRSSEKIMQTRMRATSIRIGFEPMLRIRYAFGKVAVLGDS